jgi:hypothetical protein
MPRKAKQWDEIEGMEKAMPAVVALFSNALFEFTVTNPTSGQQIIAAYTFYILFPRFIIFSQRG